MLRFTGHFVFSRPLVDLATVLDMTGLALTATRSGIRSDEPRFRIEIVGSERDRHSIEGTADPAIAEAWLQRLASAFDADGIAYRFILHAASGAPMRLIEGNADG